MSLLTEPLAAKLRIGRLIDRWSPTCMVQTSPPELDYFDDLQYIADQLDVGPEGAEILARMDAPTRRDFLRYMGVTTAGVFALAGTSRADRLAVLTSWAEDTPVTAPTPSVGTIPVTLKINGVTKKVSLDPRTVLLDALREKLAMTGTKKGCDHGQCGACTVIVNGRRVLSCLTLVAQVDGDSITTIEGLATGEVLHPLQEAFIKHDAYQCGYCTPGQICSAIAMMEEFKAGTASHVTSNVAKAPVTLTAEEIRERMSGNICRCGAYPKIVSAIQEVHSGKTAHQTWAFHTEEVRSHDAV